MFYNKNKKFLQRTTLDSSYSFLEDLETVGPPPKRRAKDNAEGRTLIKMEEERLELEKVKINHLNRIATALEKIAGINQNLQS